jgi:hypothetical protein
MTTTGQSESAVAELEHRPKEVDEIAASISTIEKAVFGSPVGHREAIRELGCSIVAQALKSPT